MFVSEGERINANEEEQQSDLRCVRNGCIILIGPCIRFL